LSFLALLVLARNIENGEDMNVLLLEIEFPTVLVMEK